MADQKLIDWEIENIPDTAKLYMRAHRVWVRNGEVIPGAFQNRGEGMSTDWQKYSTPEQTLQRAKDPKQNGIVVLRAGNVRKIPNQIVSHTPDHQNENRAHTDVLGKKDEEIRLKFTRIYSWAIQLSQ